MTAPRLTPTLLLALALALGVATTLTEAARNAAARQATQAGRALSADQPFQALESAQAALRWHPYQEPAQYIQLAALKQLGRWEQLTEGAARARDWHPDQTLLFQLAGEAAWHRGDHAAAAQNFWEALWRTPHPPQTPAQVWRIAMLEGRQAWGARDPRAAAAALRVLCLLDQDVTMKDPARRRQAIGDAAAALQAAGAPRTADVIEKLN